MLPWYQVVIETGEPGNPKILWFNNVSDFDDMLDNLSDCMKDDRTFLIDGTKFLWVVPTDKEGVYHITHYGGYEVGGRGCFRERVDGKPETGEEILKSLGLDKYYDL